MSNYSEFIVAAMEYIDEKIEEMDPRSLNRNRLHSAINIALVTNIKKLILLTPEEQKKEVENIFKTQLLVELMKE